MTCERCESLKSILTQLEWSGDGRRHSLCLVDNSCVWCGRSKRMGGHAPDCDLGLALSPSTGESNEAS